MDVFIKMLSPSLQKECKYGSTVSFTKKRKKSVLAKCGFP